MHNAYTMYNTDNYTRMGSEYEALKELGINILSREHMEALSLEKHRELRCKWPSGTFLRHCPACMYMLSAPLCGSVFNRYAGTERDEGRQNAGGLSHFAICQYANSRRRRTGGRLTDGRNSNGSGKERNYGREVERFLVMTSSVARWSILMSIQVLF
jgi:hypothetical protein